MKKVYEQEVLLWAKEVLAIENEALLRIKEDIGADFVKTIDILYSCKGRIVVLGMGKSGHIGGKIAATLASTGSPAFFVHPGEGAIFSRSS